MKINLTKRKDEDVFISTNKNGKELTLDSDGGNISPMESVLMGLAGCSSIDVVMILNKMRQKFDSFDVEIEGTRREEIPRVFTHIHMHFKLSGSNLKEKKVKEAIDLSIGKYCSVSKMLEKSAEITTSYEIF